ncbi:MAG: ABC transporter ATP-binding protein [archaeon]
MELALESVSAGFPGFSLKKISLNAKSGSVLSIVGPSGSGKTTVLRIIAGLQEIDGGKVFFGKNEMTKVEAEKRNAGFVFQHDSLFSHLNVFENVAFGLRMKKEKNFKEKALNALKLAQLSGFENRKIENLSGGEKKRVAIARAVAPQPEILLLDEPLNGLDAKLKEKTRQLLKGLQEKTSQTMVFVTHDIDEAFFLGDTIAVMNEGKIEQAGGPRDIFLHPKNAFVKDFVSDYLLVEGKAANGTIEAKFSFEAKIGGKEKGKPFFIAKKNNYKFFDK